MRRQCGHAFFHAFLYSHDLYPTIFSSISDKTSVKMGTKEKNAQEQLETLLATSTAQGPFCTNGGFPKGMPVPEVRLVGDGKDGKPLKFPLDTKDVEGIKKYAERAEVGTATGAVVNLEARTCWQLLPDKVSIENTKFLDYAVEQVSKGLGLDLYYDIKANLYKFLLYEPGCFFKRHQDTERLEGMFGTLIVELPSDYQGAELTIYSPLNPTETKKFAFGSDALMHFTALYSDCFHAVSELESGNRAALVYHLTATPKATKPLRHLPDPTPVPPQPAQASVVQNIADIMYKFSKETEADYPKVVEEKSSGSYSYDVSRGGVKPTKLAIVLSHHYTPLSIENGGLDALKGTDRAIGELIRASAWTRPKELPASDVEETPYFDTVVSLAVLFEGGECTPIGPHGFRTTGKLIPLASKGMDVPLNMGPPKKVDLNAEYDPVWFGDTSAYPWSKHPDDNGGNHSLPIFAEEILFATEGAKAEFFAEADCDGRDQEVLVHSDPQEVEFLGNGMPPPGRWYSRSVILLWPKENRNMVELQSKGGRALKKNAGSKKKRGGSKKRSRST